MVGFQVAAEEAVGERDAVVTERAAGDDLREGGHPNGGYGGETGGCAGFGGRQEGGDVAEDGEFGDGEVGAWGDWGRLVRGVVCDGRSHVGRRLFLGGFRVSGFGVLTYSRC